MKTTARAAAAALLMFGALQAQADSITQWNNKVSELITEAKLGTPPAIRVMALVQTAAHEALNPGAGVAPAAHDAAVAAAHRAMLVKLLPAQQPAVEAAYQAALSPMADTPAKAAAIAAGERAAARVLAARADDTLASVDSYRPHTSAGAYVPTATPAALPWPRRKPWLMASASQFRPAAPPALTSEAWARDFNEVKLMGGRAGGKRSAEQTEIARFWDYSLPAIYFGVVQSVAQTPGRSVAHNARLYATVAQAMDDAMISVFDAKYHHNFWRPGTAIRNADIDGNDATTRDESWAPLIDVPMHPEYASGHSIIAATVATVLKGEVGGDALPTLQTSSPTAKGAVRRWNDLDAFVKEVGDARVWGGLHYRFSIEAAEAMGRKIGALALQRQAAGM